MANIDDIYDKRRVDLIPRHGLRLVVIPATVFELKRRKIVRQPERHAEVGRGILTEATDRIP